MACLCKLCARLNEGGKCLFCGNNLLIGASKNDEHIRECHSVEDVVERAELSKNEKIADEKAVKAPQNTIATAGLILSILTYTTPIGLVLSIIGYLKSKKMNGAGKKLSIAGIALSSITMVSVLIVNICLLLLT